MHKFQPTTDNRQSTTRRLLPTAHCPLPTTRGMSLVESLVYIAVLIVLLLTIIELFVSMTRLYSTLVASRRLNEAATAGLERIVRDIRAANSVDGAGSTLAVHPGVLTVVSSATTTKFWISGGALKVVENGNDGGALTDPKVTVQNLVFRQVDSGSSIGVRVELTISATATPTLIKTESFEAFAVLRGSY